MPANCNTCPNTANLPLVVWGDAFRCIDCAHAPATSDAFEDVEPWDMTPEDAHPYNEPGPARGI